MVVSLLAYYIAVLITGVKSFVEQIVQKKSFNVQKGFSPFYFGCEKLDRGPLPGTTS